MKCKICGKEITSDKYGEIDYQNNNKRSPICKECFDEACKSFRTDERTAVKGVKNER